MKRISSSFLPPIALDARARMPMYQQLYEWFRRAILQGQLRPGQRVPSTRNLAAELKISRIPVSSAYEQLQAEGYFETFVGAGTCVARSIPGNAVGSTNGESRSAPAPSGATNRKTQCSPQNFAARHGDAHAAPILAGQHGRVPGQPARARALSRRRLVQAGESPLAAAAAPADGLRPRHGLPALPRSDRRIFGSGSGGALRRVANSGDHRLAARPAAFRAGAARRR